MTVEHHEFRWCFSLSETQTRPECTHASTRKLKGHAPLSLFSPIIQEKDLQAIMPDSRQVKRA